MWSKELLANDSAGGERHDDGLGAVNRHFATEPAADDASSHEGRARKRATLAQPRALKRRNLLPGKSLFAWFSGQKGAIYDEIA